VDKFPQLVKDMLDGKEVGCAAVVVSEKRIVIEVGLPPGTHELAISSLERPRPASFTIADLADGGKKPKSPASARGKAKAPPPRQTVWFAQRVTARFT
jgi:hypothetical protein